MIARHKLSILVAIEGDDERCLILAFDVDDTVIVGAKRVIFFVSVLVKAKICGSLVWVRRACRHDMTTWNSYSDSGICEGSISTSVQLHGSEVVGSRPECSKLSRNAKRARSSSSRPLFRKSKRRLA